MLLHRTPGVEWNNTDSRAKLADDVELLKVHKSLDKHANSAFSVCLNADKTADHLASCLENPG